MTREQLDAYLATDDGYDETIKALVARDGVAGLLGAIAFIVHDEGRRLRKLARTAGANEAVTSQIIAARDELYRWDEKLGGLLAETR